MLAAALGAGEIAVFILVVFLLFGATKLPQLTRLALRLVSSAKVSKMAPTRTPQTTPLRAPERRRRTSRPKPEGTIPALSPLAGW